MDTPASRHFTPVDLSSRFNAARQDLPESLKAPDAMTGHHGARTFRGMQFILGPQVGANVILLDRDHWGLIPLTDPIRQLAFSVTSEAVRTVVVEGRIVMRDRAIETVDEDALRGEIREAAERYLRDWVPKMEIGAERLRPHFEKIYRRANAATLDTDRPH